MDYNYKAKAEQIGHSIDKHRGDNLRTFPIEESRLRFMPYWILTCTAFFIGYGWTVHYHVVCRVFSFLSLKDRKQLTCIPQHVSVAIILQWGLGFITTVIVQVSMRDSGILRKKFRPN
jgi:hypothetical protein